MSLFDSAQKALLDRGCPAELALEAAVVVSNDDPMQPNLGRSQHDKQIIAAALPYLQKEPKIKEGQQ